MDDVEEDEVGDIALENARLAGRAYGYRFIGIEVSIGLLEFDTPTSIPTNLLMNRRSGGNYMVAGRSETPQVVGTLPGPALGVRDDPFGEYGEIPIAIQDRSFNANG